MYTVLCLVGAAGSLVVLAGCIAALWFGLRTIFAGLAAGQPDVLRWTIVFAIGVLITITSLALLAFCDRRRGMPLTLVWDGERQKWVPVPRRTV